MKGLLKFLKPSNLRQDFHSCLQCHAFLRSPKRQWLSMLPSAGETPLCSVNGDGECNIGAPQSGEYCGGHGNSTDCPRFKDFEALYMRGEQQLEQRKAEATAATNSLVFNAFIWLQVCPSCCPSSCPSCCPSSGLRSALRDAHSLVLPLTWLPIGCLVSALHVAH